MGCRDPAYIGWNLGIASALLVALVVIVTIARTPPLREHGNPGIPAPTDKVARGTAWLSLLAIPLCPIGAWLCSPAGSSSQAHHDNFAEHGARHIDAAQVDAANALTRLKLVTLCLSVTGLIAWLTMTEVSARLAASHKSPPSPPRGGGSVSGDAEGLSAPPGV